MRTEWINHAALVRPAQGGLGRRAFLKAGGMASSGLILAFFIPTGGRFARAADAPAPTGAPASPPNAFLRIAPDNTISVVVNRLECGQGINTALPMVLADELDADWAQMRSELAPAGSVYNDPAFGMQITGGSGSVAHSFIQYRELGARARAMLIGAAAARWQCAPEQLSTARGFVLGPSGHKASYGELAEDAMKLPVPVHVTLKDAKQFRYIGKPVRRLDARAKSNGTQQFGIDFTLPGARAVLVARPPVFGAKIARLDAVRARAVKGVIAVLEVPTDRGGRGVAVVAEGYWQAKAGREALDIEWDSSGLEKTSSTQQLAHFKALAMTPGIPARKADTTRLAGAARKISAVYEFPYLAHAPMEPLNCMIDLRADGCTVWTATQMPGIDATAVATTLGLKPEQVRMNTMMAGGGFGRRGVPTSDYLVEAANVAKAWRAAGNTGPLKVMWSREDDIKGGYYRPSHVHRAQLGLDEHGNIVAWEHVIVGQSILAGTLFAPFMIRDGVDSTMVEGMGHPYSVPLNLTVHNTTANVPVLWWRSVGSTHTAFVMETLIDEAAHAAGVDPVAYRKRLIDGKHQRHLAALDLAVTKSGYGSKKLAKGRAYGVALHESFNSVVAYVVEASISQGVPKLHKVTAGVHCNLAVNPLSIEAQVQGSVLMALGTTLPGAAITLEDGKVEQHNFGDYTVARMGDMPQVAVHIVPSMDPPTGMGEPGLPPLAPAFANALFRLTGKRLRKLPFA